MLTAKEMFEALGFKLEQPYSHLLHYKNDIYRIGFNLSTRVYFADMIDKTAIGISTQEHIAITQQMRELGWIKC